MFKFDDRTDVYCNFNADMRTDIAYNAHNYTEEKELQNLKSALYAEFRRDEDEEFINLLAENRNNRMVDAYCVTTEADDDFLCIAFIECDTITIYSFDIYGAVDGLRLYDFNKD